MEKKITKRDYYEILQGIIAANVANDEEKAELLEFLDKQIALIDKIYALIKDRDELYL